jgi:cytochrome c nitrite reductase small subunit
VPNIGLEVALSVTAGLLVGVGAYTFHYGQGFSYLSTDPAACANCHIMQDQYDSWLGSSHTHVAGCADCHLPEPFPRNYVAKAVNGWNHSWAFTFQNFHEPIQMTKWNQELLQENCVRCHDTLLHGVVGAEQGPQDMVTCARCHAGVGHGGR